MLPLKPEFLPSDSFEYSDQSKSLVLLGTLGLSGFPCHNQNVQLFSWLVHRGKQFPNETLLYQIEPVITEAIEFKYRNESKSKKVLISWSIRIPIHAKIAFSPATQCTKNRGLLVEIVMEEIKTFSLEPKSWNVKQIILSAHF